MDFLLVIGPKYRARWPTSGPTSPAIDTNLSRRFLSSSLGTRNNLGLPAYYCGTPYSSTEESPFARLLTSVRNFPTWACPWPFSSSCTFHSGSGRIVGGTFSFRHDRYPFTTNNHVPHQTASFTVQTRLRPSVASNHPSDCLHFACPDKTRPRVALIAVTTTVTVTSRDPLESDLP